MWLRNFQIDENDRKTFLGAIIVHAFITGVFVFIFSTRLVRFENMLWISLFYHTTIAVMFVFYLWHKADAEYTKKFKSVSDMIWNAWSFSAVAIFLIDLFVLRRKVDEILGNLDPFSATLIASIVIPAAAAKLAVSTTEVLRRPNRFPVATPE